MTKKTLALVAGSLMALSLAVSGCNKSKAEDTTPAAAEPAAAPAEGAANPCAGANPCAPAEGGGEAK